MAKTYLDDTALLEALKKHDEDAFKHFYVTSRARLFVLAMSILKNEDAAKDLLQEFYTDFWESQTYLNINISLKAYLYTAIKNRAFTFQKEKKSYALFLNSLPFNEYAETPRYFEGAELRHTIEKAIEHLPPMAAKVFRLHYLDSYSHAQIADMLGISKPTVANHIHRALTQLREELKKNLDND